MNWWNIIKEGGAVMSSGGGSDALFNISYGEKKKDIEKLGFRRKKPIVPMVRAAKILFEKDKDVEKYCGIPERERRPDHPSDHPIPIPGMEEDKDVEKILPVIGAAAVVGTAGGMSQNLDDMEEDKIDTNEEEE